LHEADRWYGLQSDFLQGSPTVASGRQKIDSTVDRDGKNSVEIDLKHQQHHRAEGALFLRLAGSWRGILDQIPAIVYICDEQELITDYNPFAQTLWGRLPKLRDPADRYCGSLRLLQTDGTPVLHEHCWMALALREGWTRRGLAPGR